MLFIMKTVCSSCTTGKITWTLQSLLHFCDQSTNNVQVVFAYEFALKYKQKAHSLIFKLINTVVSADDVTALYCMTFGYSYISRLGKTLLGTLGTSPHFEYFSETVAHWFDKTCRQKAFHRLPKARALHDLSKRVPDEVATLTIVRQCPDHFLRVAVSQVDVTLRH